MMPPSVGTVGKYGGAIMLLAATNPSLNRCVAELSPCQSLYLLTHKRLKGLVLNREDDGNDIFKSADLDSFQIGSRRAAAAAKTTPCPCEH